MRLNELIIWVSDLLNTTLFKIAVCITTLVLTALRLFQNPNQYQIPKESADHRMIIWAFVLDIIVLVATLLAWFYSNCKK
jgi:hypothetical protein